MLRTVRPRPALVPQDFATKHGQPQTGWVGRQSRIALAAKRTIDVTLSAGFGLIGLPLMFVIALAIRLDSPGPVLFRARRIGRHGKHFPMLKFRTMVADAEKRLHDIAHLNVSNGMVKIPNDPRVTRLGHWLRRFSLDELPQLYNVLVGHMSLVGPRPHDVHDLRPDEIEVDPRFRMRPGLTGLWQVTARTDPNLETRFSLDRTYVESWSLRVDLTILVKTFPVVVRGQGGRILASDGRTALPTLEPDESSTSLLIGRALVSYDPINRTAGPME